MSDVIFMRNKERKAVSDTLGFLYGSYGPIWYRGLVVDKEKYRPVQADTLDMILDRFGVEHMIVGHTIFEDVTTFHDGRLVDVNVDNRVNMEKQLGRALLVEGDRYIVVGDKGRIRDLALRSKGLFRRLNDQAAQEYLKPVRRLRRAGILAGTLSPRSSCMLRHSISHRWQGPLPTDSPSRKN